MSDILIEFNATGHEKIIQALRDIKTETNRVRNSSNKTSNTIKGMTAKIMAQGKRWKDLGVSVHTYRGAINGSRLAMEKMRVAMRKANKTESKMIRNNRLLTHSFATMRSHLLLFQFAMALGIKQLVSFTKEAAKVQDMTRAFNTLSGGALSASKSMDKLQKATNGTLSDFDLLQQANNAMILGVTKNSDEMAELFDMAQRLGDALGKDVKLSVESLVTGIGRQSRLMLDNIGIIVKADKAYDDYAAKIGKTADTLTDYEKRQAFTNATLEAARQKLEGLPDEVISSNKVFQQFSASMSNAAKNIGEGFLPIMETLSKIMVFFADSINPNRVRAFALVISSVLIGAMIKYKKVLLDVIKLQSRTGWGLLATGVGILATELISLSGILNGFNTEMDDAEESTKSYVDRLGEMTLGELHAELSLINLDLENNKKVIEDDIIKTDGLTISNQNLTTGYKLQDGVLEAVIGNQERLGNKVDSNNQFTQDKINLDVQMLDITTEHNKKTEEEIRLATENQETLKKYIAIIEGSFGTYNAFLNAQDQINKMYSQTREGQLATINTNIATTQSLLDIAIASDESAVAQQKYVDILKMLNQKKLAMLHAEEQAQSKSYSRAIKGIATVANALGAGAKEVAFIQAAGAMVDAFAGASSARFNAQKSGLLPPIPGIMYAIELAAGIANATAVYNAATKVSSVSSAPKLAEGGYIGGRPHSQGGTIIEAERGEFVMSKNATESIGLETLNQMNQLGGGSGSINVTVTGNVLTQDFVEGELAESIKEAVRRGSDFGLS
jgi:uncharacterized protein YoxC